MLHKKINILVFALCCTMMGCSHNPSTGEKMVSQGTDAVEYGEKWQKGQSQIQKGHKKIKHGKKTISKGEQEIHEGEHLLKKGEKLMKNSEQHFHEEFPEVELN